MGGKAIENSWSVVATRNETPIYYKEGTVYKEGTGDPFMGLVVAKDETRAAARVSVGYGIAKPFGEEKVSCNITLTCDQTEKMIDTAGTLAFKKALEILTDAVKILESVGTK